MKLMKFLEEIPDEQAREVSRRQLDQMTHFAEDENCRRVGLLGYFGENWSQENCGGCDHCLSPREKWDATTDVQKLISCVLRIRQAGGFSVGLNHVAEVLTGGLSEKILRWNHDKLSTHGIGKDQPRPYWVDLGRQLLRVGLLAASTDKFPTVAVSQDGIDVIKKRETVMLTRSLATPKSKSVRTGDIPCDAGLFERLRALRKELADARNVPPYVIFSDVTLRHFSRDYPANDAAMLRAPGVGEKKLDDFGRTFIEAIREWLTEHPREEFAPLETSSAPAPRTAGVMAGTSVLTLEQFRKGQSVTEIAKARNLAESTIEGHLAQAIESGEKLDPRGLYSAAEEREMEAAFEGYDEPALKPVFEQLGGRISYGKLRLFRSIRSRLSTTR